MSQPCVDPTMFLIDEDGSLVPQEHLQWRHVATARINGNTATLQRSSTPVNVNLGAVQAAWTNTTPLTQNAYALITRGGAFIELGPRNRGAVEQHWGWAVGTPDAIPADPLLTLSSRFGGGVDAGVGGTWNYDKYSIYQDRSAPHTAFLGPVIAVPPRATMKAKCALFFKSDNWTGANVDGGITEGAETNRVSSGETVIDIYAYPNL